MAPHEVSNQRAATVAGWDPGCVGRGVERRDLAGLMMMCGFLTFGPDETRSLLCFALPLFLQVANPHWKRDLYHVCKAESESGEARFGIGWRTAVADATTEAIK